MTGARPGGIVIDIGFGEALVPLAQQPARPGAAAWVIELAPLLIVIFLIYFLLVRPARRAETERQKRMRQSIEHFSFEASRDNPSVPKRGSLPEVPD